MATKAIIKAQDVLRMVGADHEDTAAQLALVSKKYSAEAAKFAQRMGKADAHAAMMVESAAAVKRRSLSSSDLGNDMIRNRFLVADHSGDLKHDAISSLGSQTLPMPHSLPREIPSRCSNTAA
jgi:hypothetical protein